MAVLQEFKCPCCDGGIEFDSATQKMKCPYCGTEFEMETLQAYDDELKQQGSDDMSWDTSPGSQWVPGEAEGLRVYCCQSCAGEIVADETLGATECPYCGNPVVMKGQFAGDLRPDLVIPFKKDKKAAVEALKNHYKGKILLPKVFKDENRIREIKGVYVPVWLFDTEAEGHVRYKATKVRHWSSGDYDYTETRCFSVIREGSLAFENVPVDGSTKMDDALMESIEPFDISEAVDFRSAYLSGYLADRYDVDAEASIERANRRIKQSTEDALRETVKGYTTVTTEGSNVQFSGGRARYALYPVWLLNTHWEGQNFYFAMNGQTGRLAGNLPVDKKALRIWRWGTAAAAAVLSFAVCYLVWLL